MFVFIPKSTDHEEFFITDSLILYFFYNLFKKIISRRNEE